MFLKKLGNARHWYIGNELMEDFESRVWLNQRNDIKLNDCYFVGAVGIIIRINLKSLKQNRENFYNEYKRTKENIYGQQNKKNSCVKWHNS